MNDTIIFLKNGTLIRLVGFSTMGVRLGGIPSVRHVNQEHEQPK